MRGNTQICQLLEMAVYDESDVFEKEPVASIDSQSIPKIEGADYCKYVYDKIKDIALPENYEISESILQTMYSHHFAGNILKRAALLALPYVINANYIISPWGKGHNKPQMAGMIAAPILIDGNKYLCCVTLLKNAQKVVKPYAIALKDKCGNIIEKEVANDINVHDNDKVFSRRSLPHGNADMSQDASTLLEYHQQIMYQNNAIKKNSKIIYNDMSNRILRRIDVIARENSEKRVTRISRSRLRGLIEEAVENVINEGYQTTNVHGATREETYEAFQKWDETTDVSDNVYEGILLLSEGLGYKTKTDDIIKPVPLHYHNSFDDEPYRYAKGVFLDDFVLSPGVSNELKNGHTREQALMLAFKLLGLTYQYHNGYYNSSMPDLICRNTVAFYDKSTEMDLYDLVRNRKRT